MIDHIRAVAKVSEEIAQNISDAGHDVDVKRVKIGALLHDVGRSRTHGIDHGVEGGRILRDRGLTEFAPFAENHIGTGITAEEAEGLDIPTKDYMPGSLEEKIVTYGDNLIRDNEVQSFEEALKELEEKIGSGHPSIERFRGLHKELQDLDGLE